MATLTLSFSGKKIHTYTLKDQMTIGRGKESDIVIDNLGVSRTHAKVEINGPVYTVTDLGSNNGTYVNGNRITVYNLNHSDEIFLGKYCLVFEDDSAPTVREDDPAQQTDAADMTMGIDAASLGKIQRSISMKNRIIVRVTQDKETRDYPLASNSITVGSSQERDIWVPGFWIAKTQAVLVKEVDGVRLISTGKHAPAVVKKHPTEDVMLKVGDKAEIGKAIFEIIDPDSQE